MENYERRKVYHRAYYSLDAYSWLENGINVPAVARYYWRYRMHLPLEELLHKETFNESLHDMIACSGRR